ncbi:hypothetical protein ArV1_084 [Arthrobacter phage vB_ArtM-ArV1]|uniref:Uncharacterized protein n=1 Tax=Arthrobacter phage vB_ArtM-ArV1 TaxID=1566993 RepID=A0A0A7HBX6_9CAUD|nr:secreted protein [Arthrobacter phage vB_ArtM-ArV1]AIZ01771.1 hypothetical protein ArV1_084 [Arthrobacter phage vB_ArtM-ArV1]
MRHYTSRARRHDRQKGLMLGAFLLVAILLVGVVAVTQNASKQAQTCTVAAKHMTNDVQDGQSVRVYQVETEECGVMRITDNALQGVFNSADLFAAVREGQRYRFTTVGWRIPFLSQFPTVVKIESA